MRYPAGSLPAKRGTGRGRTDRRAEGGATAMHASSAVGRSHSWAIEKKREARQTIRCIWLSVKVSNIESTVNLICIVYNVNFL